MVSHRSFISTAFAAACGVMVACGGSPTPTDSREPTVPRDLDTLRDMPLQPFLEEIEGEYRRLGADSACPAMLDVILQREGPHLRLRKPVWADWSFSAIDRRRDVWPSKPGEWDLVRTRREGLSIRAEKARCTSGLFWPGDCKPYEPRNFGDPPDLTVTEQGLAVNDCRYAFVTPDNDQASQPEASEPSALLAQAPAKEGSNLLCWGEGSLELPEGTGATPPYDEVLAALSHVCVIDADRQLHCSEVEGEEAPEVSPQSRPGGLSWASADISPWHGCGIDEHGKAHCWPLEGTRGTPREAIPGSWAAVATGWHHSCGIDADGRLHCWGVNQPVKDASGDPLPEQWTSVATAGDHTCGIDTAGALHCWGTNRRGQADVPTRDARGQPIPTPWKTVAPSFSHTCGIDGDGALHCWGDAFLGRTAVPSVDAHGEPIPLPWAQVATGGAHSCGIDADGRLHCWGWNHHGQSQPPSRIVDTDGEGVSLRWTAVAAGKHHTCGLFRPEVEDGVAPAGARGG